MLQDGPPVEPRPSASVIVLRGSTPFEVLMMRRPGGAEFAPNAYVFPGGSVQPEDRSSADFSRVAAVRELFEERGVLMARLPSGRFARNRECLALRELLASGAEWRPALDRLGLRPALDRLAFLTRWITPEPLRRRFDARFYACRLPAGQVEHPQAGEVVDWLWVRPSEAISSLEMVFATRRILASIADEPDAARLMRKLRRRQEGPAILPRIVRTESGFEVIPETVP
jgi:8-oxo-dGTP pyrophosphatase MutT (NUDIX family)